MELFLGILAEVGLLGATSLLADEAGRHQLAALSAP
jgi:hypothetical protein